MTPMSLTGLLARASANGVVVAPLAVPAPLPGLAFAATITPPSMPATIQVPAGNAPFLVGHATGTRTYTCEPSATSPSGPGGIRLQITTYIQRVKTTGGLAPANGCDASTAGIVAKVPLHGGLLLPRGRLIDGVVTPVHGGDAQQSRSAEEPEATGEPGRRGKLTRLREMGPCAVS